MSYCLNPKCPNPADPWHAHNRICCHCGSSLVLQQRYHIKRLLGEGGFGKTFEVEDHHHLQTKVLKVLIDDNPKAVALFEREAQVLSRLQHPGIPKVEPDGYFTFYPRNSHKPLHCLVMELIEGCNLEEWMTQRQNRPITESRAVDWLKQLVEILHQVHHQNYFHRDIKPSNIMLRLSKTGEDWQLALIDFGTVREISGTYLAKVGAGHRMTGIVSPGYTPPEQINGKAVPQSDFFALGRTFVYLLTGKHPNDFQEDPRTGELRWREYTRVSENFASLVDRLMSPFPGNRPHNTDAICQYLETIDSPPPPGGISHQPPSQRGVGGIANQPPFQRGLGDFPSAPLSKRSWGDAIEPFPPMESQKSPHEKGLNVGSNFNAPPECSPIFPGDRRLFTPNHVPYAR
ncbi:serine/threonine-protein kinase [[Phormidium] sp. ETS-05]|uniref:protein kinase domain-containing protein n=1 Tax=[Phormidium] sp. ETS-05 TaxID=222819 RepID=UPI0018EECBB1